MSHTDFHDDCLQCGYSLHSLRHGQVCPECGKSVGESRKQRRMARRYRGNWWPTIRRRARKAILVIIAAYLFLLTLEEISQSQRFVLEFCPQTFETRKRTWYEFPFLHFRLTEDRVDIHQRPELGRWLETRDYITNDTTSQVWIAYRWNPRVRLLMGETHGNLGWSYMRMLMWEIDGRAQEWIQWSKANAAKSEVLWRLVQNELSIGDPSASGRAWQLIRLADTSWNTASDAEFKRNLEDFLNWWWQ